MASAVKLREEIKLLFDQLRTAKNLASCDVLSASNKWENEVAELKEKLDTQELLFDSVKRDVETTQFEIKSKKSSNALQKQKVSVVNKISVLNELAEKLESELASLRSEHELWQEEKDKKVSEIKELWNTHCQAMHRYKKKLKIYIDVSDEDSNIFTVYFFRTDKESGNEYTVKLKQKDDLWEMLSMNPHLPQEKKLGKHLAETKDIQGFLVCVRNLFKHHRDSKH